MKYIKYLLVSLFVWLFSFSWTINAANTCSTDIDRSKYSVLSDSIYWVLLKVSDNLYNKHWDNASKYQSLADILERLKNSRDYSESQIAILNYLIEYFSCTVDYLNWTSSDEAFIKSITNALWWDSVPANWWTITQRSGCSTVTKYLARDDYDSAVTNHPMFWDLYICDEDSRLDLDWDWLFKIDELSESCPSWYHPMERWELDKLQWKARWYYDETSIKNNPPLRFTEVNNWELTHWLYDNLFEANSDYWYLQWDDDLVEINWRLKVRCVKDNNLSRNNKTKDELAWCSTVKVNSLWIEYCDSFSELKESYSADNLGTSDFNWINVCSEWFTYPKDVSYYDTMDVLREWALEIETNYWVYYLSPLIDWYILYKPDGEWYIKENYITFANVTEHISRIDFKWKKLSEYYSYNDDNLGYGFKMAYLQVEDELEKNWRFFTWTCLRDNNEAHDNYMLYKTWCRETITKWWIKFCTEISQINKCHDWYHELGVDDMKNSIDDLFVEKQWDREPVLNFPFRWSSYKSHDNLWNFKPTTPTYYLEWLNNTKWWWSPFSWVTIVKDKVITLSHYTSYTNWKPNYKYYHFSWINDENVSTICVKD